MITPRKKTTMLTITSTRVKPPVRARSARPGSILRRVRYGSINSSIPGDHRIPLHVEDAAERHIRRFLDVEEIRDPLVIVQRKARRGKDAGVGSHQRPVHHHAAPQLGARPGYGEDG